jgi:hypothetical protein
MKKTVIKPERTEHSQLEVIVDTTRQRYAHRASPEVHAKQELLLFEQAQAQTAIIHLNAAIEAENDRLESIGAQLTGLAEVLSCRI